MSTIVFETMSLFIDLLSNVYRAHLPWAKECVVNLFSILSFWNNLTTWAWSLSEWQSHGHLACPCSVRRAIQRNLSVYSDIIAMNLCLAFLSSLSASVSSFFLAH